MADWPSDTDYKKAALTPGLHFRADMLRDEGEGEGEGEGGEVERNKFGEPKARSGALGIVFKYVRPDGRAIALKVFKNKNDEADDRYRAINAHLAKLGSNRPPSLVAFRYESQGVRFGGPREEDYRWYPLQTMDWVVGQSLCAWLPEAMGRKDTAGVRRMADQFTQLVADLQKAKIAHGDLQHDNVMVVGGAPRLVDYDGMVVPALAGRDQMEVGKSEYQHPGRVKLKLGPDIDSFSAWVILIGLRAAAADPAFYARQVLKDGRESVLFQKKDLDEPARSPLWAELLQFKADPEVQRWAVALRASLDGPADRVPKFGMDPTRGLREAIRVRDWAAVAAEADGMAAAKAAVPPDLAAGVAEARERVAALDRVTRAPAADPRKVVDAAPRPALLDDWPAAAAGRDKREKAVRQVGWLDKLEKAVKGIPPADGRALVELWRQARADVAGVTEGDGYGRTADGWGKRIDAAEAFRRLLAPKPAGERAIADGWAAVVKAGPPHPLLTADEKARGEQAAGRAAALARLPAPGPESEAADEALVRAWNETKAALAGCPEAKPWADRVGPAEARLRKVRALADAVARGDDQAIRDAAAALPGYTHKLTARVQQAAEAVRHRGELDAALAAVPRSDARIADAWEQLKRARPEAAAAMPAARRAACDEAVRRRDVVAALKAIDAQERSVSKQDARWAEVWRANLPLLEDCPDADPLRDRARAARARLDGWKKLSDALDGGDAAAVRAELAARPELKGYPPVAAVQGRIDELVKRSEQVEGVLAKLRRAAADESLSADDLAFVRGNHALFGEATRAQIVAAVRRRLAGPARLAVGRPPLRAGAGPAAGMVTAKWVWADRGLLSECLVAWDKRRFLADPGEIEKYSRQTVKAADHQRNGGGTVFRRPSGPLYVTVWAVVDLGWERVYGPPLHLGSLAGAAGGAGAAGAAAGRW